MSVYTPGGVRNDGAFGGVRLSLHHLLAGVGAGVAGGICVICLLMLGSLWQHRSVWLTPNLFSTALYGPDAYLNRFTSTSIAGLAIIVVMYGVMGAFWGAIWRESRLRFALVYGALSGIVTWALLFHLFWKRLDPILWLYAPDRELEFANVIWGMIVARSPVLSRRARDVRSTAQQAEAVEVRSGELIR